MKEYYHVPNLVKPKKLKKKTKLKKNCEKIQMTTSSCSFTSPSHLKSAHVHISGSGDHSFTTPNRQQAHSHFQSQSQSNSQTPNSSHRKRKSLSNHANNNFLSKSSSQISKYSSSNYNSLQHSPFVSPIQRFCQIHQKVCANFFRKIFKQHSQR